MVLRPVWLDPSGFAAVAHRVGHHVGNLADSVVDPGTHVDRIRSVEMFQKVQTRARQIIDMPQLTPWSSGSVGW